MNAAFRLFKRISTSLLPPRPAKQSAAFRVVNISRNTELASNAELADTSAKRSKGLLGRSGLVPGEGLWIVPCESIHTFGMQFAIDVVYLDRQRRIRKIRRNIPPWRISVCFTAHSVLELSGGAIQEEDAQPGDTIEFHAVSFEEANVLRVEDKREQA